MNELTNRAIYARSLRDRREACTAEAIVQREQAARYRVRAEDQYEHDGKQLYVFGDTPEIRAGRVEKLAGECDAKAVALERRAADLGAMTVAAEALPPSSMTEAVAEATAVLCRICDRLDTANKRLEEIADALHDEDGISCFREISASTKELAEGFCIVNDLTIREIEGCKLAVHPVGDPEHENGG